MDTVTLEIHFDGYLAPIGRDMIRDCFDLCEAAAYDIFCKNGNPRDTQAQVDISLVDWSIIADAMTDIFGRLAVYVLS